MTLLAGPDRVFAGFGLGAIQAGLLLYEAQRSGAFDRLVVAEVVPQVVDDLRAAGGRFKVNVAHSSGIEQAEVGPIEVYNPNDAVDRAALIDALAAAGEIATAVPSVAFYTNEQPGSIHRLLAAALLQKAECDGPHAVLYTAENHNHAAEILTDAVTGALRATAGDAACEAAMARVAIVNTVIGKMSGVHPAMDTLAPITPGNSRAFLVEEFNHILIGAVRFRDGYPDVPRGLSIFEEKGDLLPFEEAKLYGHNAMHALAGYLGRVAGAQHMADIVRIPGLIDFVRAAVLGEPGHALLERYALLGDPLFTETGFAAYVDDLLTRMVNPFLRDPIDRVCRDPERKLAWDDRLVGAMRLSLSAGVAPRRFAVGVAAALDALGVASPLEAEATLRALWNRPADDAATLETLLALVQEGRQALATWRAGNFANLDSLIRTGHEPVVQ